MGSGDPRHPGSDEDRAGPRAVGHPQGVTRKCWILINFDQFCAYVSCQRCSDSATFCSRESQTAIGFSLRTFGFGISSNREEMAISFI